MRAQIGLKFGTLKELIKADLHTNFGKNPMNIHDVMTDYSRKIRSKVCHAHRVNLSLGVTYHRNCLMVVCLCCTGVFRIKTVYIGVIKLQEE